MAHVTVDEIVESLGDAPGRRSLKVRLSLVGAVVAVSALDLATGVTDGPSLLWAPIVAVVALACSWTAVEVVVVLAAAVGAAGSIDEGGGALALEVAARTVGLLAIAAGAAWVISTGRELARRSRVDFATGLLNRAGLVATLERERQRSLRSGSPLTLVYLDLDGLKDANDVHGHDRGDELIRRFAVHLDHARRTVDAAARLGGDEFALVLPATDRAGATQLLERLYADVAEDRECLPVSAGAVTWAVPPPVEQMVCECDRAMYDVKRRGGAGWTARSHRCGAVRPEGVATRSRPGLRR